MGDTHLGDLAELHALGALHADESAALEAHLRGCSDCAAQVAAAHHDVALVASMETQRNAPPQMAHRIERIFLIPPGRRSRSAPFSWPMAGLAAAFLIGMLPSLYFWKQNASLHGAMLVQTAAMERLATTPHRTAFFRATPGAPPAEVAYAPDGSWYVVMVHGASKALTVAWMHGGARTLLGSAVPRGTAAMLYLPKSHRMDQLALMDGERIVADAQLSW